MEASRSLDTVLTTPSLSYGGVIAEGGGGVSAMMCFSGKGGMVQHSVGRATVEVSSTCWTAPGSTRTPSTSRAWRHFGASRRPGLQQDPCWGQALYTAHLDVANLCAPMANISLGMHA